MNSKGEMLERKEESTRFMLKETSKKERITKGEMTERKEESGFVAVKIKKKKKKMHLEPLVSHRLLRGE